MNALKSLFAAKRDDRSLSTQATKSTNNKKKIVLEVKTKNVAFFVMLNNLRTANHRIARIPDGVWIDGEEDVPDVGEGQAGVAAHLQRLRDPLGLHVVVRVDKVLGLDHIRLLARHLLHLLANKMIGLLGC